MAKIPYYQIRVHENVCGPIDVPIWQSSGWAKKAPPAYQDCPVQSISNYAYPPPRIPIDIGVVNLKTIAGYVAHLLTI